MVSIIAIVGTKRMGLLVPGRRRRYWSDEEKRRIVAETLVSGASVSEIALKHGVNANLVFTWRRDPRFDGVLDEERFLPVMVEAGDQAAPVPAAPLSEAPVDSSVSGRMDIELGCGTRLRVDRSVDGRALARVLRALRSVS
jgi:transposase